MKLIQFHAATLLACLILPAWPQEPRTQGPGGDADRPITLNIVVTDKSGGAVGGLQQNDFTILDNKRPQPITCFRAVGQNAKADPPVRVVFVIDEVNISFRAMSNARQQLEKYLRQFGNQLPTPMSLVIFNEKSTQVQGTPTQNGNVLADSVHAVAAGAPRELEGSLYENEVWRLQISLRALAKLVAYEGTQPGRKLLIWLSGGWPLFTESEDTGLTTKRQRADFHTLVGLSTELRDGQVTLYSIDPLGVDDAGSLSNNYYQNFLGGVPSADKFRSGDLTLGVIATQSGGQVLNRSNDVAELVHKCVADATSYYSLTFESNRAGHPDEYHELQVKIDKPGFVTRTRTGYYAEP